MDAVGALKASSGLLHSQKNKAEAVARGGHVCDGCGDYGWPVGHKRGLLLSLTVGGTWMEWRSPRVQLLGMTLHRLHVLTPASASSHHPLHWGHPLEGDCVWAQLVIRSVGAILKIHAGPVGL